MKVIPGENAVYLYPGRSKAYTRYKTEAHYTLKPLEALSMAEDLIQAVRTALEFQKPKIRVAAVRKAA